MEDNLLFAGEATITEGEEGTVPGAMDTGVRAAREVLAPMKNGGRASRIEATVRECRGFSGRKTPDILEQWPQEARRPGGLASEGRAGAVSGIELVDTFQPCACGLPSLLD